MRSLILFMIFLVLAVLSLTMPSIGVLTWAWIAIMSPHRLIWIMVLSIGYFGVKGGGFTIANGGAYTVLGPPESIIEDRNHLALACCMIIPMMNYLRVTTANRLIKIGLMLAMALTIISVIGSYSRGGFLALSVTAFVFWLRSSGKMMTMVLLLACFIPAVSLMPSSWKDRISSIENYQ